MAVKVLHSGNSLFPLKITCPTCGALLEIESVQDLSIANRQRMLDKTPYVTCPDCDGRVTINGDDRALALDEKNRSGEWR